MSLTIWHVFISGFTQHEGRESGLFRVAEDLISAGHYSPRERVSLLPWKHPWGEFAERLWIVGQEQGQPPMINVYAYSWGVGYGARRFAAELGKRSMGIECLVSSDGIWKAPWWPGRIQPRALFSRDATCLSPRIQFGSNVKRIVAFHQCQNRPNGHVIFHNGNPVPSTQVHGTTHQYMDDSQLFRDAVFAEARALRELVS